MKYHSMTLLILCVAIALYLAGYTGAGNIAFIGGAIFETWFWVRLLVGRRSGGDDASGLD